MNWKHVRSVMKKFLSLTFILFFTVSLSLSAQYRKDVPSRYDLTGPVINTQTASIMMGLNKFFQNNVKMSHSYSMSFGSYGGSYQNVNAYTNTMEIMFTDNLQGRVDVSFLHSPFGGSNFVDTNNNLGGEVMIRNAELNYQINDNASIHFQYQRLPSYGYGPYNSPFSRYNRFSSWY